MRPILLKGHSRSLTMIKYNREGDLLFSCAKDHSPNVWFSDSGERLGTFNGHTGAVWACDVSYHSERLLTAAADSSVKLWDVQTGDELVSFPHTGPVRSVNFSTGDKFFCSVVDKFSDHPAAVCIYELAADPAERALLLFLGGGEAGNEALMGGLLLYLQSRSSRCS